MADISNLIAEVCEDVSGEISRDIQARLCDLKLSGSHRRFLVSRMGSTGSTWLAKLLNGHPDVFCYHEGVIAKVYPARKYGNDEILAFINLLSTDLMHGAYLATGDVGSTWINHLTALPKNSFFRALLMRHPAKILSTRLKVFPQDRSFTEISERFTQCIQRIWGIDPRKYDEIDRIFLQDAFIFAGQVRWLSQVDLVIQIEKMNDPEYCGRAVHALTGLDYERCLVRAFLDNPINVRTGGHQSIKQTLLSFTAQQRKWYEHMLGDVISRFGYSLDGEVALDLASTAVGAPGSVGGRVAYRAVKGNSE